MKKFLAVIISVLLIISALPFSVPAYADTPKLLIEADGILYEAYKGEIIDYVYCVNTGEKVCSLDGTTYYDAEGLEIVSDIDDPEELFPIIGDDIMINNSVEGRIKYNFSKVKGKSFNTEGCELIRVQFRVTADSGTCRIHTDIVTLAGANEHKYIYLSNVVDPAIQTSSELENKQPCEAPEAPTEAPTDAPVGPTEAPTEAPTDAPVEPTEAPPTETPYEPTTPSTEAPTEAPPTEAAPTEAPTEAPTIAPTEPLPEGLFVKADGVYYPVRQGEIFEYVYYLNTGEKVCSVDAVTYFDTDGLEHIFDEDDDDSYNMLFPIIGDDMTLNSGVAGRLKYNYSHTSGKKFNSDDCELIHARFRVTADDGVFEINTMIHTLAGANEYRYIYIYEEVHPLNRKGSAILNKSVEPTEAPTEAPAEVPTEVPTDAPVGPTEAPTEAPAEAPTETPTDAPVGPTEAPTEAPAEVPTETPTEPDLSDLYIKADGVLYAVKPGETVEYVYYLCTGESLCSLQADTYYDVQGLEHVYDEEEPEELFPILFSSITVNIFPGDIKYNFSSAKGKKFKDPECELIHTKFTVTATEGVYEINTLFHTVAGAGENKYISYYDQISPLVRSESVLIRENIPTEAPTEAPATAPTEPAPRRLTDPATGISIQTELGDSLSVEVIPADEFNYYIANSDRVSLYRIAITENGEELTLTEPVTVFIPSGEGAEVFTLSHTTNTDMHTVSAQAVYENGMSVFETDSLGLFMLASDGTADISMYGDVDGDNEITIVDATWIQRKLAKLQSFTEDQDKISDVCCDGETDILDSTHIQRWLAKLDNMLTKFGYPV